MKRLRSILPLSVLAALAGVAVSPSSQTGQPSASTKAPSQGASVSAASQNSQPVRQAPAPTTTQRLIAMNDLMPPGLFRRDSGMTPKEWGMSQPCRRMVRASHMRSRGIAGQRI